MNKDDPKIQAIAQKIMDKIENKEKDGNFTFVITTLMIISIVLTLIRVLQECNKTRVESFSSEEKSQYFGLQIKEKMRMRSWITKNVIKKTIRKELCREDYKKYGIDIMYAILQTGEVVTDDEVITLMEAANV